MRFSLIFILVLLLDQISKKLVTNSFQIGESKVILEGFLALTYIHNAGAAFGILQGKFWFFLITASVVIIALVFYNLKYSPIPIVQYASALIAGGSLGNLIDRILYGSVIDFFSIGWWPIFNIADMAIVLGGILMAIYILFFSNEVNNDSMV